MTMLLGTFIVLTAVLSAGIITAGAFKIREKLRKRRQAVEDADTIEVIWIPQLWSGPAEATYSGNGAELRSTRNRRPTPYPLNVPSMESDDSDEDDVSVDEAQRRFEAAPEAPPQRHSSLDPDQDADPPPYSFNEPSNEPPREHDIAVSTALHSRREEPSARLVRRHKPSVRFRGIPELAEDQFQSAQRRRSPRSTSSITLYGSPAASITTSESTDMDSDWERSVERLV